jgi:hypothetical protein
VRSEARAPVANRGMITVPIMLATVMQGVDNTIANVALPHTQGSLSAAQDQIAWVLTSYIVAVAIVTPLTGSLAGRLGIKYVFLISVGGFTLASALCGSATSLSQLVVYRLLQGACGDGLDRTDPRRDRSWQSHFQGTEDRTFAPPDRLAPARRRHTAASPRTPGGRQAEGRARLDRQRPGVP